MAFVTFVIPTLGRDSLKVAMRSLDDQTVSDWNAILVNDPRVPWQARDNAFANGAEIFRVRLGRFLCVAGHHQSAGLLRNEGIATLRTMGRPKWIAFLDDDDALAPEYVAHLREHDEDDEPEAIVFRMYHPSMGMLPDVYRPVLAHGRVGISFAVREDVLPENPFIREDLDNPGPDGNEDIALLRRLQAEGADIMISQHVDYLVRPEDWRKP